LSFSSLDLLSTHSPSLKKCPTLVLSSELERQPQRRLPPPPLPPNPSDPPPSEQPPNSRRRQPLGPPIRRGLLLPEMEELEGRRGRSESRDLPRRAQAFQRASSLILPRLSSPSLKILKSPRRKRSQLSDHQPRNQPRQAQRPDLLPLLLPTPSTTSSTRSFPPSFPNKPQHPNPPPIPHQHPLPLQPTPAQELHTPPSPSV